MFKKLSLFFLLLIFLTSNQTFAQTNKEFLQESKKNFLSLTKKVLESKDFENTKIYLVTISPGVTVFNAFGHTALRIQYNKDFDESDFYVDFGQYDESLIFLWKFLRGNAGFYFSVVPTASAYEAWDSSGRGFLVSELKMNSEIKEKMLTEVIRLFDTTQGYEYNNFKSNCVTFVRDLIEKSMNVKLQLATSLDLNTGRKITVRFSDKIIWLRIEEKLLFDHDTDKERVATDRIFMPMDLQISVEDAKIIKESKQLIPDRWKTQTGFDYVGYGAFFLFVFVVVSQIPKGIFANYKRNGQVLYSLLSGLGGSFALMVVTITKFDFMDENIVVLAFTPLDFFLLKKNFSESKHFKKFIVLRLIMLCLALLLRMTLYKQNIDFILFFSFLFFGLLALNAFTKKNVTTNAV